MDEPIDFARYADNHGVQTAEQDQPEPEMVPSNDVYARVGDEVKLSAHDGVRRGLTPEDIVREIVTKHNVRLTVGELRLLLAGRRVPR